MDVFQQRGIDPDAAEVGLPPDLDVAQPVKQSTLVECLGAPPGEADPARLPRRAVALFTDRHGGTGEPQLAGEHRVAIVTGATSGIGLAVTRTLASQGHRVYICARHGEAVAKTMAELRADALDVDGSACGVTSPADVSAFVRAAVAHYGSIDVLVNNAGRSGGGVTADLDDDLWFSVINTNLNSVFLMTREVMNAGGMRAKDRGRIINIASTAGKQGVVLGAPYSASKHGVVRFTKALGNELGSTGITVNAVCPGYVETPMAQAIRHRYAVAFQTTEDEILRRFEAKIPLGRYSTPEEVAGLVGYLATDTAASITAQAINVCGGLGNF